MANRKERELEQARRDGMAYALKIAKTKGVDALETECKMRQALKVSITISDAEIARCTKQLQLQMSDCICAIGTLSVLDMYANSKYGVEKAKEYRKRFAQHMEDLGEKVYEWQDVVDELFDRGIRTEIRLGDIDETKHEELPVETHHRKVGGV